VVYWVTIFLKDIMDLELGAMLSNTWRHIHRALTISSVWSQVSSQEVTAHQELEDQAREEMTYVTTADKLTQ
jgi:hypothetical protein